MSLGPGLRTPEVRPGRQILLLGLLALASAWVSNALAGPTRHLAWRPEAAPAPAPPPRPIPPPPPATPPLPPTAPGAPTKPPSPRPPQPLPPKAPAAAPSLREAFPPPGDGAPVEIGDDEAHALHRAGAAFLDARRTALYEEGHIAGAKVISPWEDGVASKVQAYADATFDPKDPLVIYCSGGDCRDSHLLADRLWPLGFRNIRIYRGGWPAWSGRGWPSAKGPEGAAR